MTEDRQVEDIRLPNGHIYRNVPVGTGKDVIKARAIADGVATEQDFIRAEEQQEEQRHKEVLKQMGVPKPSKLAELELGFDAETSDLEDWSLVAEAELGHLMYLFGLKDGIPHIYSPQEQYGEEFMRMSVPEKKAFLRKQRSDEVINEHAKTMFQQYVHGTDDFLMDAGGLGKELFSPTTIIPFGGPAWSVLLKGAAIGGQAALAEQLAEDRWDPVELGTRAVLTGVTAAGISKIPAAYSATKNKAKQLSAMVSRKPEPPLNAAEAANKTIAKVEEEYARLRINEGIEDPKQIHDQALKNLNLTNEELIPINMEATSKLAMPSKENASQMVFRKENPLVEASKAQQNLDYALGRLTTRIGTKSRIAKQKLRQMEFNILHSTKKDQSEYAPFFNRGMEAAKSFKDRVTQRIKSIPELRKRRALFTKMDNHLGNGNWAAAQKIIDDHFPEMQGTLEPTKKLLERKFVEGKDAGVDLGQISNYFPRVVKDVEGLRKAAGFEPDKGVFHQAKKARAAEKKLFDGSGKPDPDLLDEADVAIVLNKLIQGHVPTGSGFKAPREIPRVPLELQKYYYSGPEALEMYIDRLNRTIEFNKFYGGTGGKPVEEGTTFGEILAKASAEESLSPGQIDELRSLLNARYVGEKNAMSNFWATMRDASHAMTLANPASAMIQLADVSAAAFQNGLKEGATSLLKIGSKDLTAEDLGVINKLSAEVMNSESLIGRHLPRLMKYSLFARGDRVGKDVIIDSSLAKHRKMAQGQAGQTAIRKEWTEFFGDEGVDQLIRDLADGKITEDIKLLTFNDLSDVQPITPSEMPEAWLRMKSGRIVYTMKSFYLTQLDMIRRGIIAEYKRGNKKEALRNAAVFSFIIGGSNMSLQAARDGLREWDTKPFEPGSLKDTYIENFMGLVFLNKYNRERYLKRGDYVGFFGNIVAPPAFGKISDAAQVVGAMIDEDGDVGDVGKKAAKLTAAVPVIGDPIYNYLLGGMEKRRERRIEEEYKKAYGL